MKFLTATVLILSLAAPMVVHTATPAEARSTIERACMKSDRRSTSRPLCQCIQRVADVTLSRGDQRLVATFFKNPDKAQDVRMSQSRRDDEFWDRYTVFTQQAGMACQG